jgi:DNA invertase Pin-like site-specific DNA recombinase
MRRPEFERLQSNIFHGKVKMVIIWKLDRLSRNLREGVNVLADWADGQLKIVIVTHSSSLAALSVLRSRRCYSD